MRKIFLFNAVICAALSVSFFSITANASPNDENIPSTIESFIECTDLGTSYTVRDLYSYDGSLTATCLEFESCGYLIYDTNSVVIEFSETASSPYYDCDQICYYAGPLSYYVKANNGKYEDINSNELLFDYEFENMSECYEEKIGTIDNEYETYSLYSDNSSNHQMFTVGELPHSTRLLDYNNSGACGSLAATIMMCYYHDYINSNYLYSKYSDNDYNLYQFLIDYIETSYSEGGGETTGSNIYSLAYGLQAAMPKISSRSNVNVTYQKDAYDNIWSRVTAQIVAKKTPSCLSIHSHPIYGNHWVVAIGSTQLIVNGSVSHKYFVVNDGWGNNNIKIISSFSNGVVYIQ